MVKAFCPMAKVLFGQIIDYLLAKEGNQELIHLSE
jgi:hypothetical protein